MKGLKSERIQLRDLIESDWIGIHEYASQEQVCRNQPWGPNSLEDSQGFVTQGLADSKKIPRTRYLFAIVLKDNGKMIGAVEINIRSFNNKTGEISYIVNPDYWGKGIATEAGEMIISFGFRELELHRIYATCAPENMGSKKVLEKLGMSFEGKMRENLLVKEGWRDSLLYSVLVFEWLGQ